MWSQLLYWYTSNKHYNKYTLVCVETKSTLLQKSVCIWVWFFFVGQTFDMDRVLGVIIVVYSIAVGLTDYLLDQTFIVIIVTPVLKLELYFHWEWNFANWGLHSRLNVKYTSNKCWRVVNIAWIRHIITMCGVCIGGHSQGCVNLLTAPAATGTHWNITNMYIQVNSYNYFVFCYELWGLKV